ncbi:hypothetical protein [Thalassotalea fusca]
MNSKLDEYLTNLEKLLDYRGMAWWLIDLTHCPDKFYCNQQMCHLFALHLARQHTIEENSPFVGEKLNNIAQINAAIADKVNEEYQQLLDGSIDEYANQFPYYNCDREQTLYFSSRAKKC